MPFHLATPRLSLRPLALQDLERIHEIWTNPGVRKFLWDDEIIARELAASVISRSAALFEKHGWGLWAVLPRGQNTIVGFGGYWHFFEPPELQLLFGLAPEYWNQGFATEMARALLRYGFEICKMDRITGCADAPNLASLRVMEKAGMKFEKRAVINGRDTMYYAISFSNAEQNMREGGWEMSFEQAPSS